ncbi:MAG: NAD-dependent epimerase/dehydratase family protein [Candidatus Omnitrophica bacterium]|nr:NAD-dependent epimerase/dehydratase family protein [Candidatus Omnitrophota bacterium]
MFEACLKEKIERVVYLSSTAVIAGNSEVPLTDDLPFCATNNYGQSKIEAERVALQYRDKGLKTAIIRPPMVYGEEEPHLLSLIVRLIRWRLLPIIGEGNNKLHMVDIDNVVDVMLLCLSRNEAYEGTYIVADNEVLSTKEFLGIIAEAIDVRPPLHMHKSLIPFLEHTPFLKNKVTFFTKDRVYSIERIRDRLGYNPRISIYDGLRRVALACRKKS